MGANDQPVVLARDVTKTYRLYDRPIDRLWEKLGRRPRHRPVHALKGISVEVPKGAGLGVVGSNGAGKSTFLKVLSGTTLATTGEFQVRGKVSSLLELGTGFYPGFTGLQNIHLAGTVMGFSRKEIAAKVDEIIEFSELGGFIHQPIRTYSSGMIMRLGFSVATAVDPDVLIIDEILAVGDLHFQKRCIDRIMSFRAAGKTILFCSHSMYHVEEICDHAIWIQDGRLRMYDKAREVCKVYERFERARRSHHDGRGGDELFEAARSPSFTIHDPAAEETGEAAAAAGAPDDDLPFVGDLPQVQDVRVLRGVGGEPARVEDPETGELVPGAHVLDDLVVEIDYDVPQDLPGVVIGCGIYRGGQEMMAGLATHMGDYQPPSRRGHYTIRLELPSQRLLHGEYRFVGYVSDERGLHIYHSQTLEGSFLVKAVGRHMGVVLLEHSWSTVRRGSARPVAPAADRTGDGVHDGD